MGNEEKITEHDLIVFMMGANVFLTYTKHTKNWQACVVLENSLKMIYGHGYTPSEAVRALVERVVDK